MRPAFLYYLLQAWTADPCRPARRQAPAQALAPAAAPEGQIRHATRPACC